MKSLGDMGLMVDQAWWRPVVVATAFLPLALCLLGWPDAGAGVLVHAVILVAPLAGPRVLTRMDRRSVRAG